MPPIGRGTRRRDSDYAQASAEATTFIQKGAYDKALDLWTRFLSDAGGGNAGRALNHMGDLHARMGARVDAMGCYYQSARAFESSGYTERAVAALRKVLRVDPGQADAYLGLAHIQARFGRVGDAVEAYLSYARLLSETGREGEIADVFSRVRILDPVNVRHRMQVAEQMFRFGLTEDAALESTNAADLLLQQGRVEEAERCLAKLCERLPERDDLVRRLAEVRAGRAALSVPDWEEELLGPGLLSVAPGRPGGDGATP